VFFLFGVDLILITKKPKNQKTHKSKQKIKNKTGHLERAKSEWKNALFSDLARAERDAKARVLMSIIDNGK